MIWKPNVTIAAVERAGRLLLVEEDADGDPAEFYPHFLYLFVITPLKSSWIVN